MSSANYSDMSTSIISIPNPPDIRIDKITPLPGDLISIPTSTPIFSVSSPEPGTLLGSAAPYGVPYYTLSAIYITDVGLHTTPRVNSWDERFCKIFIPGSGPVLIIKSNIMLILSRGMLISL